MAAKLIEQTLRRMLNSKERLSKKDALVLKDLILADGYLSRSERRLMNQAIDNGLLDDDAFEVFLHLLLNTSGAEADEQFIA